MSYKAKNGNTVAFMLELDDETKIITKTISD